MSARIVVTGMGAISPYGVGLEPLWSKLMAGETGLRALPMPDFSHVRNRAGGQLEGFHPEEYLPARLVRKIDRLTVFGLIAAQQALADAGLSSEALEQPVTSDVPVYRKHAAGRDRVGITVGGNMGGWSFAEHELGRLWKDGPRAVSPYLATAWFPTAVQGIVSIQLGIKGIGRTFLGERVSGAYAIKHAAHCLRQGYTDRMFTGGAEAPFSPYAALYYETSNLMSSQSIERPTCAYRPFDRDHDGLVAGEGAAFLFLERAEDAVQRGAKIYAEIAGWATTNDGYDDIQPAPDGVRYAETMQLALERAGVSPEKVDCVFAAGSAIPVEDLAETRAIRLALGQRADSVPVTAPKSAFGNLFGAATPLDVVIALLALQHRVIPPTLHLDNPAPGCDLEYVAHQSLPVSQLDVIAVNTRGTGGSNACLVLRRWS